MARDLLLIFGAGGHGKVVADTAEAAGWGCIYFYDDRWPLLRQSGAWPIKGDYASFLADAEAANGAVVAIGNNKLRLGKLTEAELIGAKIATIIHPRATVSRYSHVGTGSVVLAGAVLNADAKVGRGCIINTSAIVEHDCEVGDGVHISPGAKLAGNVSVGNLSWVGLGASLIEGVCIGTEVVVGAGAVVLSNCSHAEVVVGVPAKRK